MAKKNLYVLVLKGTQEENVGLYHCTAREIKSDAKERGLESYKEIQTFEFLRCPKNASELRMKNHLKGIMEIEEEIDLDVDQRQSAIIEEAIKFGIRIGRGEIPPVK